MLASPITSPRRRLRRWGVALGLLVAAGWLAERALLPTLVASRIRHELELRGFPHATFHVASVGLYHLRLTDLRLADGLDLGEVELDAGLSLMWHDRVTLLTIRGARIAPAALAGRNHGVAGIALPRLRLEDCVLELGGDDAELSGTIALPHVDLHFALANLQVGTRVLHGLDAVVHDAAGELELCAAERDSGIVASACGRLPASVAALIGLREVSMSWLASSAAWSAHGVAHVDWHAGLALDGHVDASFAAWPAVRLGAEVTGSLAGLAIRGDARADRLALGTLVLDHAQLPFTLAVGAHGEVTALARAEVTADDATLDVAGTSIAISRPVIALHDTGRVDAWPTAVRWRAASARTPRLLLAEPSGSVSPGARTVAWRAATAGGLALGSGELAVRVDRGGPWIERAHVNALGGELSLVHAGRPSELAIAAHGIELARALTALGRGEAGTGRVDGELVLKLAPGARFTATGTLRAAHLALHAAAGTVDALDVRAPFAIRGGATGVALADALVITGGELTLRRGSGAVRLVGPSLVVGAVPRMLWWTADSARAGSTTLARPSGTIDLAGGLQTFAWTALEGSWPLHAEAGELAARVVPGGLELVSGRLHAGGGELAVEATTLRADRPVELMLHARGLDLAYALPAITGDRLCGHGVLDGDLALRFASDGSTLTRGSLHARAPGELRVSDPAWLARASAPSAGLALQQRLLGTLADFAYAELAVRVNPRGVSPEVRLTARGRGQHTPQELDLVINLNGLRDAVSDRDRSLP